MSDAPRDIVSGEELEQRQVLENIGGSRFFSGAPQRMELLRYLYEHRSTRLTEVDIAIEHFGIEDGTKVDNSKVRKLCGHVRQSLIEYADNDVVKGDWRFFLPPADRSGYQLRVVNIRAMRGADHHFWYGHLEPARPVTIVYDEPMFYRDDVRGTVLRVPQVETGEGEKSFKGASDELQRLFRNEAAENLHPCHLYTLSGEIAARDRIAGWFADEYGMKVNSLVSRLMRDFSDLSGCSPIVLGSVRTSKILAELTMLHQYGRFGYFVDKQDFRTLEVIGYTEKERAVLADRYGATVSDGNLTIRYDPRPDKIVFCVVTRMPNPYDKKSAITILNAGYSKALETLAQTLTSRELFAETFAEVDLDMKNGFPRYFQGLFSVRLGATGQDDKPGRPVLRCYRQFQRFME